MKKSYVLIGDTHPEMISIAREAAVLGLRYKIFLPFYLTDLEAKVLTGLFRNKKRIIGLINQRTLPKEISNFSLRRPFVALYLASYILRFINSESKSKKLMNVFFRAQRWYLQKYLILFPPYETVIYDTYLFDPFVDGNLVVICPHVHPNEVVKQAEICLKKFPNWLPETTESRNSRSYSNSLKASRIIVLSQYSKKSFIQAGYDEESIFVIPIGPINSKQNEIYRKKTDRISVVYVGRIVPLKGLETFIGVARELQDKFSFKIIGSGNSKDIRHLRELTIGTEIELVLNPENNAVIFEAYSNGDVFLLPSYCEGFSIATLEAMSFGLIPIVTINSALPEILKDTKLEKFLIEPDDIESIVALLRDLSKAHDLQMGILRKEAIDIAKNYSMEKFGQIYWQEIEVSSRNESK